ncbi:putative OHCU decarboxylase-domain-containing protein [Seiridium cardinale]|uniref:OHCU decarboxylase-domain-containing protein n=1 Tax=Seiridium cardinale TaxID=138064 RepID=A0ABR2XDJ1_9PEZI
MPQFTPLQFKINIKNHNDLGLSLISKHPVHVDRPPHVPLQERIPRNGIATSRTMSTLPPISELSSSPIKIQLQALDLLFEPSTELHTLALPALKSKRAAPSSGTSASAPPPSGPSQSPGSEPAFDSYASLIQHIGSLLQQLAHSEEPSARQKLHGVLGSHPRLGAKKVDSAQSQAEQASLNAGAAEEGEKLKTLNEEYEAKFPGLRYVVFVNGRSRPVIMENMRQRIDRGDIKEEEQEAIRAMVDIALDRAKKLQASE